MGKKAAPKAETAAAPAKKEEEPRQRGRGDAKREVKGEDEDLEAVCNLTKSSNKKLDKEGKGKKLMTSVQWPFFVGFHTAMRFDGWTFEQNTRPGNDAAENLNALQKGGKLFGTEVRRVMENVQSFDDAVQTLDATNWAAPMYMILAGAGEYEGAVITIDRGGKRLAESPPVQYVEKESGSWHLLQTNDDLDKPAQDPRRPIAEMLLKEHDQSEVSEDFMWQSVRGLPLYVDNTAFSWVASPKTGYHRTVIHSEPTPEQGSLESFVEPLVLTGHQSLKRRKLFKNPKDLSRRI